MSTAYKCDECGACCKTLIIEIQHIDVVREPGLLSAARLHRPPFGAWDDDWEKTYSLASGSARPCPLLGPDCRCGIYPTRPNVCVAFAAGDEQCQDARRMAGLSPLLPVA